MEPPTSPRIQLDQLDQLEFAGFSVGIIMAQQGPVGIRPQGPGQPPLPPHMAQLRCQSQLPHHLPPATQIKSAKKLVNTKKSIRKGRNETIGNSKEIETATKPPPENQALMRRHRFQNPPTKRRPQQPARLHHQSYTQSALPPSKA